MIQQLIMKINKAHSMEEFTEVWESEHMPDLKFLNNADLGKCLVLVSQAKKEGIEIEHVTAKKRVENVKIALQELRAEELRAIPMDALSYPQDASVAFRSRKDDGEDSLSIYNDEDFRMLSGFPHGVVRALSAYALVGDLPLAKKMVSDPLLRPFIKASANNLSDSGVLIDIALGGREQAQLIFEDPELFTVIKTRGALIAIAWHDPVLAELIFSHKELRRFIRKDFEDILACIAMKGVAQIKVIQQDPEFKELFEERPELLSRILITIASSSSLEQLHLIFDGADNPLRASFFAGDQGGIKTCFNQIFERFISEPGTVRELFRMIPEMPGIIGLRDRDIEEIIGPSPSIAP